MPPRALDRLKLGFKAHPTTFLASSFWHRHFWHRTVFGTNVWHRLRASPRAFPIRRLRTWRQRDLGWILWFYPYTVLVVVAVAAVAGGGSGGGGRCRRCRRGK